MVVELTRRKHAELAIRAAVEERDAVLAVISHDLRNPLQTVQASSALLAASLNTTPRVAKYLDVIERSTRRMRRLVDELVVDAQLRAGAELAVERIAIDELVAHGIELFEPVAHAREVRLRFEPSVVPIEVDVDRARMLQVIGNLLDNAIRHSSRYDEVHIGVSDQGDRVAVSVGDHGAGMTDKRARQALAASLKSRTLGLYICKRIVEAHGGALEIDSELGRGTVVRFALLKPSSGSSSSDLAAHPDRALGCAEHAGDAFEIAEHVGASSAAIDDDLTCALARCALVCEDRFAAPLRDCRRPRRHLARV